MIYTVIAIVSIGWLYGKSCGRSVEDKSIMEKGEKRWRVSRGVAMPWALFAWFFNLEAFHKRTWLRAYVLSDE
jgi:hypothetical protein